jgi:hypothetical protein
MKRGLAVFILVASCAGCVALQRTPDATVLQSLRTIAVIPVEPPPEPAPYRPLLGRSPGEELLKGVAMTPVGFPVVVVYMIYRIGEAMSKAAPLPGGTLTVEKELPSGGEMLTVERERQAASGMLTMDLAMAAAETLQRSAGRTVYLVDCYLRLPRVDRSQYPGEVIEDGNARIKRWYNEDVTQIDYSGLKLEGLDAILEVGILGTPKLQAMVRLVDPTTKQVLGRARDWTSKVPFPVPHLTKGESTDLITPCLKDLGLLAE